MHTFKISDGEVKELVMYENGSGEKWDFKVLKSSKTKPCKK